jgi:hypothetical protein
MCTLYHTDTSLTSEFPPAIFHMENFVEMVILIVANARCVPLVEQERLTLPGSGVSVINCIGLV